MTFYIIIFFFFQAEDGIRDGRVTGVQTCALPIWPILHSPSVANMGNPHAVFWVDDVDAYDLGKIGPLLESHPVFPDRANISLAQVVSREYLIVRTWERGAGLTRACGSAACAALVCASRIQRT